MELKVISAHMVEGRQIIFLNLGVLPDAKEKVDSYLVITKANRTKLGDISWDGKLGKYMFVPDDQTMYDETCMRDIADFLESRTRDLKIN